jgi:hypothetical protein
MKTTLDWQKLQREPHRDDRDKILAATANSSAQLQGHLGLMQMGNRTY